MKKVTDRTIIIQWGKVLKWLGTIQDYWGLNDKGELCALKIQLTHNTNSEILNKRPNLLLTLPNRPISKTSFVYKPNEYLDNKCQYLYSDYIIFSYTEDGIRESHLIYKELCEDVYLAFTENMQLQYLILKKTLKLKHKNSKKDFFIDKRVLEMYFKIYTYNQDDEVEISNLINEISTFVFKNKNVLDNEIISYFKTEIFFLKEDLD